MNAYTPRPGSIPTLCVEFFQANPDEVLTVDDISQKFNCISRNVHTLLAQAVENELLERTRNEDGEYVYHLQGCMPASKPKAVAPKAAVVVAATAAAKPAPVRKMLDISKLKVEEGIPYLGDQGKGQSKWTPLFAKLTKPGQSIEIPADMRGAVGAAIGKINSMKTQGTFRVAMVTNDTARVWRTA